MGLKELFFKAIRLSNNTPPIEASNSSHQYQFKSPELQSLSQEYARTEDSLTELVDKLQNDIRLKRFASESELDCVMDTEDFYKYLRGTSIVLEGEKFIIYDASMCGFPDYLRARNLELTEKNVQHSFPNFTPRMFKAGMQRYIQTLDKVFYGNANPSQFDRKGKEEPMAWLVKKINEKKEE